MPIMDELPTLSGELPRIVQLSLQAAKRLGYRARIVDPAYGYLFEVSNGCKERFFVGGMSPLNDAVGARIAQDKFYTAMVLSERGFRVTNGVRCLRSGYFKYDDFRDRSGMQPGIDHARHVGYPVIVKPNRMALGRDVLAVQNEAELVAAVETVWKADYIALVQEVAVGADLRLDFIDGTFLAGYRRRPVVIRGDGRRSVRTLLSNLDRRYGDETYFERRRSEPIWSDRVIDHGWDEETVLLEGQEISFDSPVLNLNRWSTAEVLDGVPEGWLAYCVSVGSVLGLRHFGIDLRVPVSGDGSDWMDTQPEQSVIIEVNASPALVQLHELGYADRAIEGQARVLEAAFREG